MCGGGTASAIELARKWSRKAAGKGQDGIPRPSPLHALWTAVIAFAGMMVLSALNYKALDDTDYVMLIGSQAASAVLVFNAIQSPLAQPRNVVLGNAVSAFAGVACRKVFSDGLTWVAAPAAVALAILAMDVTRSTHPPGGATSLIAVIGSDRVRALGWMYILVPAITGSLVLVVVAVLLNNLASDRHYPTTWMGPTPHPQPPDDGVCVSPPAVAQIDGFRAVPPQARWSTSDVVAVSDI